MNLPFQTVLSETVGVTELQLSSYVGIWYQMYSNQMAVDTFQANGSCISALYEHINGENFLFSIENYQSLYEPGGEPEFITGISIKRTSH